MNKFYLKINCVPMELFDAEFRLSINGVAEIAFAISYKSIKAIRDFYRSGEQVLVEFLPKGFEYPIQGRTIIEEIPMNQEFHPAGSYAMNITLSDVKFTQGYDTSGWFQRCHFGAHKSGKDSKASEA